MVHRLRELYDTRKLVAAVVIPVGELELCVVLGRHGHQDYGRVAIRSVRHATICPAVPAGLPNSEPVHKDRLGAAPGPPESARFGVE